MKLTKSFLKELVYEVNGAAIEVHKTLGPGLLESVYQRCLAKELSITGIKFISQLVIDVNYKGMHIDAELKLDFLVEDILPVELKSVNLIMSAHEAQLMTYMKLLELPKGLLINFNVSHLYSEGQKTYVNEFYRNLPE